MSDVMNITEVAALLGVSIPTVYKLIEAGLPTDKNPFNNRRTFPRPEVESWCVSYMQSRLESV